MPRTSSTVRPLIGVADIDSTRPARIPRERTASSPDSGSITRPLARTRSNVCPNEIPRQADKHAKRSFLIDLAHLTISEMRQTGECSSHRLGLMKESISYPAFRLPEL